MQHNNGHDSLVDSGTKQRYIKQSLTIKILKKYASETEEWICS